MCELPLVADSTSDDDARLLLLEAGSTSAAYARHRTAAAPLSLLLAMLNANNCLHYPLCCLQLPSLASAICTSPEQA